MSKLEFVTAKEFQERVKENDTDNVGLRKQFTINKIDDLSTEDKNILKFAITTNDVDRDNDILSVSGWDFEDYKKNPVVLWGHDYYQPPVGKAVSIAADINKITSEAEFTSRDLYDFGYMVYRMLKEGFLNAVSVGFDPTEYSRADDREYGINFEKQSLLEYSVVPVPANPNALIEARSKGIDVHPMKEWAEKVLDDWDGEGKSLLLPKTVIEEMRKQIDNKTTIKGSDIDTENEDTENKVKDAITYGEAHADGTPISPKDTSWSGPEQITAANVDDLKIMCAWVDDANNENKGAYKLPHHQASGEHSLVWRGVTAAMGALLGARGGVDIPEAHRRGVYNHLAEHYKEYEEEPPEFKFVEAQVLKHLSDDYLFENGKLEKMTDEKRLEIDKQLVIDDLEASKNIAKTEQVKAAIDKAIAAFEQSFNVDSQSGGDIVTIKDENESIQVDDNFLNELKETTRLMIRQARGKLD